MNIIIEIVWKCYRWNCFERTGNHWLSRLSLWPWIHIYLGVYLLQWRIPPNWAVKNTDDICNLYGKLHIPTQFFNYIWIEKHETSIILKLQNAKFQFQFTNSLLIMWIVSRGKQQQQQQNREREIWGNFIRYISKIRSDISG